MNRKYLPLCIVLLVLFIQPKTALCQAPAGQLSAESDKWSLYVGLGMGYLPFQYDEFSPTTGGAYDERKVFSIMSIQVPVSVQYRRRYELEIRHFSVLQFGYYHPLENFSINTIGLGINPLAFLNEKLSHTFFIKIKWRRFQSDVPAEMMSFTNNPVWPGWGCSCITGLKSEKIFTFPLERRIVAF
jgi:hypothetical protein